MRGDFWMTRFRGDSTALIQRLLSSARQIWGWGRQAILCFYVSALFLRSVLFSFLYVTGGISDECIKLRCFA